MKIKYNTRDGDGNDIVSNVEVKEHPIETIHEQLCPVCGEKITSGCRIDKIVSSNFTDWSYFKDSKYVCPECSKLFSLYFYSYIVDQEGIRIINVRNLEHELISKQNPPFIFCITASRKKHLFYKAHRNYSSSPYCVNLETETIKTTPERMKTLFDFVECMQTLGQIKVQMQYGEIGYATLQKLGMHVGMRAIDFLTNELNHSSEIQIPLYCGQKRDIPEEEALCVINSILMMN